MLADIAQEIDHIHAAIPVGIIDDDRGGVVATRGGAGHLTAPATRRAIRSIRGGPCGRVRNARFLPRAAADGRIGEDHDPETHLIPLVIDAALGRRASVSIFGTDYPTPDGTCLRDYVHVDDLARAHIAAFDALQPAGVPLFYNLGTGQPCSVREIIACVEAVSGQRICVREEPRRAGDPPALYADASKAQRELDWQLEHPTIHSIIESAWRWHQSHPNGYAGN